MIKGGYIIQPRLFDASSAAKMPPCAREVWMYLLRNVNYKDSGKIKRGQGLFVMSEIAEALSWSVGYRKMAYSRTQIMKALRRLNEESMTTTTKTARGVIVTIRNYELYQDPTNYEDTHEGTNEDTSKDHTTRKMKKESLPNFTPLDVELADYLASAIKAHSPNAKLSTAKWPSIIRLMRERDNRTEQGIRQMIDFATNDEFWRVNILSASSLRKQFDKLMIKSLSTKNNGGDLSPGQKTYLTAREAAKDLFGDDDMMR